MQAMSICTNLGITLATMIPVIHQIVTLIIATSRLAIITVVVTPSNMHVGKNAVREEHGQEEV
jgi:hypothetical protein